MTFARMLLIAVVVTSLGSSVVSSSGSSRPVAVAYAGFNPETFTFVSAATIHMGPSDARKSHTLFGSRSFDPDGDSLTYLWECDDKVAGIGAIWTAADLQGNWPEGEHRCTLSVSDGSFTSTDTVVLNVKVDRRGPNVTPPDDDVVAASEAAGARPNSSESLDGWLNAATAVDDLGGPVRSIGPLVGGQPVSADTLFPIGQPTEVTFRFVDAYDNIGTATATVVVKDLREGDVFVAATRSTSGGASAGRINRVRDGVVSVFCETPAQVQTNPLWWGTPQDVIVDSSGRVVFIANLPSGNSNFPHRGLFYCDFPGDLAHLLAVYPGVGSPREGSPIHFGDKLFGAVNGLHLERVKATAIDDDVLDGGPQTETQDAYVFTAATYSRATREFVQSQSFRYLTQSAESEEGPEIVRTGSPPPDMTNYRGDAYSAAPGRLGRVGRGVRVDVRAKLGDFSANLRFRLFAGLRQIGPEGYDNYLINDLTEPDYDSGCKSAVGPMPSPRGGPHNQFFGLNNIVIDPRFGGMVLTSTHFGLPRYLTGVEQFWLDDNPENDRMNTFTRYELGCITQQSVGFTPLHPDVAEGDGLVVGPDGLYGLASTNRVIRIRPGASDEDTIATGAGTIALAVWPPQKTEPTGGELVVRVNSPVDVLLTDDAGRRLGVDPSGNAVNDFGGMALDSGPGTHPRFYVIKDPGPARYQLRSIGTGDGPFKIQVYSSDLSQQRGSVITTSGVASPGTLGVHDFTLSDGNTLAFVNQTPVANAGSDVTFDATSPDGAAVTLNAGASGDPDGHALQYRWTGPFGVMSGAVVETRLPIGSHAVRLEVEDPFGATASDVVVITVNGPSDVTPPVLTATRTLANAHGWNNGEVVVEFTCTDGESAIALGPVTPVTLSDEGAGQSVSATCEDAAGNRSSMTIDGINIDRTAPAMASTRTPEANAFGWNNTDVSVGFSCADALSGVDDESVAAGQLFTFDGANQSANGSCRDRAGNEAATTVAGINIDKTPPVISGSADRPANAAGWYSAPVSVQFECTDTLSGVVGCDSAPQVIDGEGQGLSRAGTATDAAGNRATAVVSGINIDTTPPSATCSTDVTELWPPNHRLVPVTARIVIADSGSGAGGFVLDAITSNEGDETDMPEWTTRTADTTGRLRAARSGTGDGRLYTLEYLASDLAGNTALCFARVAVPHDRRK